MLQNNKIPWALILVIIGITLLVLFAGCGQENERVSYFKSDAVGEGWVNRLGAAVVDECFLYNWPQVAAAINQKVSEVCGIDPPKPTVEIMVTWNLPDAGQAITPTRMVISDRAEQLPVFGHEWLRYACLGSGGCCSFTQKSIGGWTGNQGVLWNFAENVARRFCG